MKSLVLTLALVIGICSARADDVGRYQLLVLHTSGEETLYRIDTTTGQTWKLMEGSVPIPTEKLAKNAVVKLYGADGWMPVPDSFGAALKAAMKEVEDLPVVDR